MINDSSHSLEAHLQRINEKLATLSEGSAETSGTRTDMEDKRTTKMQRLQIGEDSRSEFGSLTDRELSPQPRATPYPTENAQNQFEAYDLTSNALSGSRNDSVEIINRLQERLHTLTSDVAPKNDEGRLQLQEDIETTKQ